MARTRKCPKKGNKQVWATAASPQSSLLLGLTRAVPKAGAFPGCAPERGVQNRNLNAQTIPFVAGFFNALAAGLQKVDIYVNNDDYHQQAGLSLTIKRSHFAFIVAINRVHSVVKQSYPFTSAETIIVRS